MSDNAFPGAVPVADGIWMIEAPFDGVPLMLYIVDGGSKLALVDSGISTTPDDFILPIFAAAGRQPDLLINTHGHVDHFGGNFRLKQVYPELEIAAHRIDARWIEDTRRHLHEFYMQMPDDWQFEDGGEALLAMCGGNTAVDIRLEDGDVLDIGERSFQVLQSAGHSPGHICLFEDRTGLAITGDVALGWGPATAADAPDAPAVFYDVNAYLAGARMAEALAATVYCTGHFGAIDHAGMARIVADSNAYASSLEQWALDALGSGEAKTLHQIAVEVAGHIPTYDFGFHLHASVQSLLERQSRAGMVRTSVRDGRRHYAATARRNQT